jgi:tRNA1Val (adenine37-N6)-methyltransferase
MDIFNFKKFSVAQDKTKMKIGTDGVLLGSWTPLSNNPQKILDIGTGTGVIALMLAQRTSNSIIDAVEIDSESFLQAKENFETSPWPNRLQIFRCSIQDYIQSAPPKYDLIVSNPPYFSNGTPSKYSEKNLVKHTNHLTHNELLDAVSQLLHDQGIFSIILPDQEGSKFIRESGNYGLYPFTITNVYPKKSKPISRVLMLFKKIETNDLILLNESDLRNDRTLEYQELTSDFYL